MNLLKSLLAYAAALLVVAAVYLPVAFIVAGVILLAVEKPEVVLQLLFMYTLLFVALAAIYRLAEHTRTKAVTQTVLWVLVIAFLVHAYHSASVSSSACTTTKYVDC